MMHTSEFEAVQGLPSGLCSCRIGGKEMRVAAISPCSVQILSAIEPPAGDPLELFFLRPETGSYEIHTIQNHSTGKTRRENGAVLTRFCFDDPAVAAAVRRMLNGYARYLETKSCEGASAYAALLTGYPEAGDEIFMPDLAQQRRAWFEGLVPLRLLEGQSLAVELNCPELWRLYLETPISAFPAAYAALRNIPRNVLPESPPDRLYIGNAYCGHLFPDEETLRAIAEKACSERLNLTLVTAGLQPGAEAGADRILARAREYGAEIEINDWGMLERAHRQPDGPRILLGTRLNRRRKDPRMAYKAGLQGREGMLARSSLNDAAWRNYLGEFGVERYEFESCALPAELPPASCSLHLPFYQTNTSVWCPIQAICERGSRGAQADAKSCPGWCGRNVLLYPLHLKMLGRWNSVFGLDAAPELHSYDRLVLNF